jgi:hypothetical protein
MIMSEKAMNQKRFIIHVTISLVVATLAGAAGCGGSNRGPTTPTAPSTPTTPASAVTINNLAIDGEVSLNTIGGTSQLRAMATFSNGNVKDVTRDTMWTSLNPEVITISSAGLLTAVRFGVGGIYASYQSKGQNVRVRVAPPSTSIFEVAGIKEGLEDEAPQRDLFVVQDPDGGFTLRVGTGYTIFVDFSEPVPGHCIASTVSYSWEIPAISSPCFPQIISGWWGFHTPDASNPQTLQEQHLTLAAEDRSPEPSMTRTRSVSLPIRFRQ